MTPEQLITGYIQEITKGMVTLTPYHAAQIVNIAKGNGDTPFVKQHLYNMQSRKYEFIMVIKTTQTEIDTQILKALDGTQVMECYAYECYNAKSEMQAIIYTSHAELF